jgi:hypothetical protein
MLAAHLARNPICHSVVRQQRRERQRDVNPRIRQWRESLLGMFVGGDARTGSNTPNGHLLMGEAAAGSGVSVDSLCQATRRDGKSIRFSRRILSREAKRPRTEAYVAET